MPSSQYFFNPIELAEKLMREYKLKKMRRKIKTKQ